MLSRTQPTAKAGAPILYGARAQFNGRHDPTVAGFSRTAPRRFRIVSASHKAASWRAPESPLGGTTRQYWEDQRCVDGIANFDSARFKPGACTFKRTSPLLGCFDVSSLNLKT